MEKDKQEKHLKANRNKGSNVSRAMIESQRNFLQSREGLTHWGHCAESLDVDSINDAFNDMKEHHNSRYHT